MQSPLLDVQQLESFAGIGYADYLELLADVIHDVPGHLDRIRASIEAGDPAVVSSRAHSFRGMVSYFGCVGLTDRLAVLEQHPEGFPADQGAAIHTELQSLWDRSLAAIKDWEKSMPGFAPE